MGDGGEEKEEGEEEEGGRQAGRQAVLRTHLQQPLSSSSIPAPIATS
jgi:hypothetical protein